MKTDHSFIAERAAAQHCAELLRRGAEPADNIGALAGLGARLAPLVARALERLLGGDAPAVSARAPQEIGERDLTQQVGPLAANTLYATGLPGVSLLGIVPGAAVLQLVDRAYGGSGSHHGPLPAAFPLSADLLVERLEQALGQCLGEALGAAPLEALRRAPRLAEFAPFPAAARLAVLSLEVAQDGAQPWDLTIALPLAAAARLIGTAGAAPAVPARSGPADPAAAPFSEIPLGITATLVDMPVSLAALTALEPGAVLPVAVARAVPLSIGGRVIARGTVGTQDDRVALRLTQLAS